MKSTRRFFEGLGIWVMIMPFLHFPTNIRNVIYVLTGATIFIVSYLYLRRRISTARNKIEPTFVESMPQEISTPSAQKISDMTDSENPDVLSEKED